MSNPTKYLGLELGGSKSARTAVVVLDYYKDQNKVFLAEILSHIEGDSSMTGDARLIETMNRFPAALVGVNAPLSLPPCLTCKLPVCPMHENCTVPAVEHMRKLAKKLKIPLAKHPTPYTQRPGDVALREFDIPPEETLGAGRGPLAARMQYLKRHFKTSRYLEVNARIALQGLGDWFGFGGRELRRFRDVEFGAETRFAILERLGAGTDLPEVPQIFLYRSDLMELAQHLVSFDAFLAALTALVSDLGLLEKPQGPEDWGFVATYKKRKAKRRDIENSL
jgi:hypothetical protein